MLMMMMVVLFVYCMYCMQCVCNQVGNDDDDDRQCQLITGQLYATMFADDTTVFGSGNSVGQLKEALKADMTNMSNGITHNK